MDHICLTTNELIKLRADVTAYTLTFGTVMLIIGFVAGVIVWWSLPIAREYIRDL